VKSAALSAGALGCSISGSGPSVFALCAGTEESARVGAAMEAAFGRAGLACDLYLSAVNTKGPVVLEQATP
jgi:homoserine kinase